MLALDNGFQEAVAIVSDAAASAARVCTANGFAELLTVTAPYGLREVLIGHPQAAQETIRFFQPPGPPGPLMRDGAQALDTGGIFDINLRALRGIEPLHSAFDATGFIAHAPITTWDFGSFSVREVVESDAVGLCIALMDRLHPPLVGYEGLAGPASWAFNSTQIFRDFAAVRRPYRDCLGWQVVEETNGFAAIDESGVNCMGLLLSLAPTIAMQIGIYHPSGRMEGSVEIISFGLRGHDLSARSVSPNRGWAALRFPVSNLAAFAVAARTGGCTVTPETSFDWEPHGRATMVAATTPWGARLEAISLSGP